MQLFKLISVLLEYPSQDLIDNLSEVRSRIAKNSEFEGAEKAHLYEFIDYLAGQSLTQSQIDYVKTFDGPPEHSLHMTHHLFGDESDRNRGPALIDLSEMYKEYGVELKSNELPDFLPLILEFASGMDDHEAKVFLSDINKVLCVLRDNLNKANSPYATLIDIVEKRATLTRLAA